MEVGAVKQAFNNEVIQLKKNLNQAKIQVIHKLTRKAKTLTEKKTPDHLKEKNKRKAESAVKEVLLIKKIKPRDIARFIITYKGDLNSQLNKPVVDNDKACARLLLNKSLQLKYKTIKDKFGDVPIKDLLMSRQERRKLKKEAKEAQKNKKKGGKVVNSQGDWNVEDVNSKSKADSSKAGDSDDGQDDESEDGNDHEESDNVMREVVNGSDVSSNGEPENDLDSVMEEEFSDKEQDSDEDQENVFVNIVKQRTGKKLRPETAEAESEGENISENNSSDNEDHNSVNVMKIAKPKQVKSILPKPEPITDIEKALLKLKPMQKPNTKVKDNKNKNLNVKMQNRKFKKDNDESQSAVKVVDPFFKTSTGDSYMSVAEPRQPDEVKEVHRQGNRQERRAVMFGRAPRRDNRNFKSDKFNRNGDSNYGNDRKTRFNDNFNRNPNFNDSKFDDRKSKFNDRTFNDTNSKFIDSNSKFNDRNNFNNRNSNFNDKKTSFNNVSEPKVEKLHPSWEAKKKQSGILPFKGKKIVFDEN